MGECSACIPRERVLAVCEWAKARAAEIGREKNAATLQAEVARVNSLRRMVWMRQLNDAEVHEKLSRTSWSYPWRWWWRAEFGEMLTLARDAEGGIRVSAKRWQDMLRWCEENGWKDEARHGERGNLR